MIKPPAVEDPSEVRWYQGKVSEVLTSSDKIDKYYRILFALQQRATAQGLEIEHVFCEVTDTINFAARYEVFLGMDTDLKEMGFKIRDIPGKASMDLKQKNEFREMILRGGSYSG